jgi:hypothetical protein
MARLNRSLAWLLCLAEAGRVFAGAAPAQEPTARPPAPSLMRSAGVSKPDARGFIRRWRVLEPFSVTGPLTETAVETNLRAAMLVGPLTDVPGDAEVVQQPAQLRWHAVDTRNYNVNLYHFAWALSKPTSNVLFWVVTTVDAPMEMHDVRLAIGSNAASRWWVNGQSVVSLYGDRQTVIDDGVSRPLTLRKGRNVIRAAIINGGGATDFCARFLDADLRPITSLSVH